MNAILVLRNRITPIVVPARAPLIMPSLAQGTLLKSNDRALSRNRFTSYFYNVNWV
jgi:hypothetical protein